MKHCNEQGSPLLLLPREFHTYVLIMFQLPLRGLTKEALRSANVTGNATRNKERVAKHSLPIDICYSWFSSDMYVGQLLINALKYLALDENVQYQVPSNQDPW